MLFTFFYYILFIIIFIFLQNFFAEITSHAIFISITVVLTMTQIISSEKQLFFIIIYGLFFDIIFTETFGFYFIMFILIFFPFKYLTNNVLNFRNISLFTNSIVMFVTIFIFTLIHDFIIGNITNFFVDIIIIFMCSSVAIFEFLIFKKIFEFFENISNKLTNYNSKKHS